ncbi:hypothetical protein EV128_101210 [Rhizobium azibense]|nr:hypothetical protein EV128_101210 [Rhizobium azibense]
MAAMAGKYWEFKGDFSKPLKSCENLCSPANSWISFWHHWRPDAPELVPTGDAHAKTAWRHSRWQARANTQWRSATTSRTLFAAATSFTGALVFGLRSAIGPKQANGSRNSSSAAMSKSVYDHRHGRRHLTSAGIIEMVAGERLTPVVQNRLQLPRGDVLFDEVFRDICDPVPV